MKERSRRMRVVLGDSAVDEQPIVFYRGEMVEVICPYRSDGEKMVTIARNPSTRTPKPRRERRK
jgi:hypothetical protein